MMAYLVSAAMAGLICTGLWVGFGGSFAAALLVYFMSGNLVIAAMLARAAVMSRRPLK